MQTATINRRILLASYPKGRPQLENFHLDETPLPAPDEGQVLLRTLYLSLDPYMRNLMDKVGPGYAPPIKIGTAMVGGTVSQVVASRNKNYQVGELVLSYSGWQDYALSDGNDLNKLGDMAEPSLALGGLGMPGFAAYVGLLDVGRPQAGETLVVAAATGAVGAVVGQIGKLKGLRVVGVAGGADKCRYATEELGFDACIDRYSPSLAQELASACPQGVDIYFENVGGEVFNAVLPLFNLNARIPVCGFISYYNDQALPAGPNQLPLLMAAILQKRIRVQGFIVFDYYATHYEHFKQDMHAWVRSGKIKFRENKVQGLENAAASFIGLLEGKNFGKLVVKVANPE